MEVGGFAKIWTRIPRIGTRVVKRLYNILIDVEFVYLGLHSKRKTSDTFNLIQHLAFLGEQRKAIGGPKEQTL